MAASTSTFSWNEMYMNPDAVLSSVADRLGIAKGDVMDPSSSDAAVKQAHAETHVIGETKEYFKANGVDLQAFQASGRDAAGLLVKNFPYGTTVDELKSLFASYGDVIRCLLPPSGTIALIQYAYTSEGNQALAHLAYRNFKGSILYLEQAPRGVFTARADPAPSDNDSTRESSKTAGGPSSDPADDGRTATLFVRNLDFATTSLGLAEAFKPLEGYLSAKVKTKVEPSRPKEVLSMGFGFVEFQSERQAKIAMEVMNGKQLDRHKLVIQFSRPAADAAEERRQEDELEKKRSHRTKLIIKNLPFQATKKDVRALLGAYGKLRSVKVPQKFDRSTRGFAFADFVSGKEAEHAIEALRATHLLGRRLVMEFAQEEAVDPEQEVLAMEDKVGRQTEMIKLREMTSNGRKAFALGTGDDES